MKSKMSMLTFGSLFAGLAFVVIGILLNGRISGFLDAPSVMITIGGTLCATIMSYPARQLKAAVKGIKLSFKEQSYDANEDIELIIGMANVARKSGLLSLEGTIETMDNHFVRKGIMLIMDGSSSEMVKTVMQTENDFISMRHEEAIAVFKSAAAYAPAFGMIGTLIGLINMLLKLSDPSALGPSMSVALVTTFYGTMMANLFFTPIANKLTAFNDREQLQNEMVLEGILSIQDGENPTIIRDKLEAFVAVSDIRVKKQKSVEVSQ